MTKWEMLSVQVCAHTQGFGCASVCGCGHRQVCGTGLHVGWGSPRACTLSGARESGQFIKASRLGCLGNL